MGSLLHQPVANGFDIEQGSLLSFPKKISKKLFKLR
jgi:hypothetical protein